MRGRPKTEKTILFTPQPKSAVSLLLSKRRIENCDNNQINLTSSVNERMRETLPEREENSQFNESQLCVICSHRSENIEEHRKHMTSHKQFSCDYGGCLYTSKLLSNLIKHKRIHTDERPYLCDRCSFRTNFINSLKVHKRTHTLERPYSCKHCSYKCNSSSNLKKHCLHRHPELIK